MSFVFNAMQKDAPLGSYTCLLDDSIKATFTSGAEPTDIHLLAELRPKSRIELVTSALGVTWYQPTRNIWIECKTQGHALQVFDALDGKSTRGVTLHCTSRPFMHGKRWTVQVLNATESITNDHLLTLLPPHVQEPGRILSSAPQYDPLVFGIEKIMQEIANVTNRTVTGTEMLDTKNKMKYRARSLPMGELEVQADRMRLASPHEYIRFAIEENSSAYLSCRGSWDCAATAQAAQSLHRVLT